jgi:hypothetical protein
VKVGHEAEFGLGTGFPADVVAWVHEVGVPANETDDFIQEAEELGVSKTNAVPRLDLL